MSNTMYFSKYEERVAQMPSEESNRWEGRRGESRGLPRNEHSKVILDAKEMKQIF